MRAIVLLSGGIDSTTCLASAVKDFDVRDILALSVFYGQKHDREIECAKRIAEHYGVEHTIRALKGVFDLDPTNPMLKGGDSIRHESYASQLAHNPGTVDTYVPFRNGLLLSYAAAIAYSLGAVYVIYGAHADDAAGSAYPDCTSEFFSAMAEAVYRGTGQKVHLGAPLIEMNKAQVVAYGLNLDAPYHLTWSCYEGRSKPCGKCGTCLDRQAAFSLNGQVDPLVY